jgi:hypothetical protein
MLQELVPPQPGGGGDPGRTRDPFVVAARPEAAAAATAARATPPPAPPSDPLADVVAGLSLDATFIQGRDQLAIINGRIYQKGQTLTLPGPADASRPPLSVLFVRPTGVLLKGGDKNYLLGYSDQLVRKPGPDKDAAAAREAELAELDLGGQSALFERLLNSPLGALGRGLLGDALSTRPPDARPSSGTRAGGTRRAGPARP